MGANECVQCGMRRLSIWLSALCLCGWLSACGPDVRRDILLFNGAGSSANDVRAIERLLDAQGLDYTTIGSDELNAMSAAQLKNHKLLIVPGGNFEEMGNALTPAAARSVREAVHGGLSYLGLCAGAFIAGASPYNGFNLTGGVRFKFYALEARSVRKAAVAISIAGSTTFDHYWEDGPELSGWGETVAKYPDGAPAVTQGFAGAGWVVLTGIHPEAPESWRAGLQFRTSAAVDNAFAAQLIRAALTGKRLPYF